MPPSRKPRRTGRSLTATQCFAKVPQVWGPASPGRFHGEAAAGICPHGQKTLQGRSSSTGSLRPALPRQPRERIPPSQAETGKLPPRPAYLEAVARYEQALLAFQAHEYGQAIETLRAILATYPDEKELHERVRLYLQMCERQQAASRELPQTLEERLYAATLAINAGALSEAVGHLESAREQDPDHDQALYMLAIVQAQQGNLAEAAELLQRAVEINPENRSIARNDPDLDALRAQSSVRSLLEAPLRTDRRRAGRNRGTR